MNRRAALIVPVLLICCLSEPVSAFAAAYPDAGAAASTEIAGKKKWHIKKRRKFDVDALVKDKVISKETGEKVKAYLKQHSQEWKAEHEKIKSMTEEQRQAYFKEKYPNGKPNVWADMAAAGVITPDEANAIQAALHAKHEGAERPK